MTTGIYKLEAPNGKVYIGQSIDIEGRWDQYLWLKNCKGQTRLYNSFMKYGPGNFNYMILVELPDASPHTLDTIEYFWMMVYDALGPNGLNCKAPTGKPGVSDETRARMRAAQSNRSPEWRERISQSKMGHVVSDESRAKLSASHTGRKMPEDQRMRMIGRKGHQHTDETKARMSEAQRKVKHGPLTQEHKDKIRAAMIKHNRDR